MQKKLLNYFTIITLELPVDLKTTKQRDQKIIFTSQRNFGIIKSKFGKTQHKLILENLKFLSLSFKDF